MAAHEIIGSTSQMLKMEVSEASRVISTPGAMVATSPYISMNSSLTLASTGEKGFWKSLLAMIKRKLSGEKVTLIEYKTLSYGEGGQPVIFAPDFPGEIQYFDIDDSDSIYCKKGAYLCSDGKVDISFKVVRYLTLGLFSKLGLVLQHLTGNARIFFSGNGSLHKVPVTDEIVVDTKNLVAFSSSLKYELFVPKAKNQLLAGDGLFLIQLSGQGNLWLQSYDNEQLSELNMASFKAETRHELKKIKKAVRHAKK